MPKYEILTKELTEQIKEAKATGPLSMEFSRHKYWSGLPCLPPGDLPKPRIKPMCLMSPALTGKFFTASAT